MLKNQIYQIRKFLQNRIESCESLLDDLYDGDVRVKSEFQIQTETEFKVLKKVLREVNNIVIFGDYKDEADSE